MPPKTKIVYGKKRKYAIRGKRVIAKKGLNTKEKSQVTALAKKAVQKSAEKKFMDSVQFQNVGFVSANAMDSPIAVMGYSTTESRADNGAVVMYGTKQVDAGLCLRPFYDPGARGIDDLTAQYHVIGKEVQPRTCHTRMRIVRKYSVMNNNDVPLPLAGNPSEFETTPPPSLTQMLGQSLPIEFRMIRCTQKGAIGTTTLVTPNDDLFNDKYGNPTGVGSADFGENEIRFLKVNTRKWSVIEDKRWTLQNPLTLQYTFSRVNGNNTGWYIPQITNENKNCEKMLNMHHRLTNRKNGKVHYNEINDETSGDPTTNPSSGMRREYVFIHAYYKGATDLYATDNPPAPGQPNTQVTNPVGQISWNLYNSTTFTDF